MASMFPGGDPPAPPPPRFDPYRIALTGPMRALVDNLVDTYLAAEKVAGKRTRARRPADLKVFKQIIEAVVTDLLYQHSLGHKSLRITRNKRDLARRSRYSDAVMSEQLPDVLDFMESNLGMLVQVIGETSIRGGNQTEIAASPRLLARFNESGLGHMDVSRREGEELVLLKGTRISGGRAELAEYEDDAFTASARAEIRGLNAWIRDADISYSLDVSRSGFLVDARNRHLRRIFTRSTFGSGGRLFGGFWQSLGKAERLTNVLIYGEPVASLDYTAMLSSLAYAYVKQTPPAEDAYVTAYTDAHGAPVVLARATVKKLFAATLFAESPLTRWPRGLEAHSRGLPVAAVLAGIKAAHPALVPLMFKGLGHVLQFHESEILVDVLLQLKERDVVALPLHDCVVVPESDAEVAREVMLGVAEWHQKAQFRVTVETAADVE